MVFARLRQSAARLCIHASLDLRAFLDPTESTSQTESRSVQPFLHSSRQGVMGHPVPVNISPLRGGSEPPSQYNSVILVAWSPLRFFFFLNLLTSLHCVHLIQKTRSTLYPISFGLRVLLKSSME